MTKRILRLLVTLTTMAVLSGGGVALSQATTPRHASGESSTESTAPENSAADPDNVQYTAPGDADYHGAAATRVSTSQTPAQRHRSVRRHARHTRGQHAGARHSGIAAQSAPDPDEQAGESESSIESEQGQPGEPANGHQDASGQSVNHECTGDCVE